MLTVKTYENPTDYLFEVTDGTSIFQYRWGKTPPKGQTVTQYLQNCKREAELLAQHEIGRKAPAKEIAI